MDLAAHQLAEKYLRQIQYQKSTEHGQQHLGNALNGIWRAAGQQNLLILSRLRQLWRTEVDPFLAQHSYPRNLANLHHFSLGPRISEDQDPPAWQRIWAKLQGSPFASTEEIILSFRKGLRRPLSEQEVEQIQEHTQRTWRGRCLHLIVYDASFVQTLRLEKSSYLQRFQALLPQASLIELKTQVGSPRLMEQDGERIQQLERIWPDLQSPLVLEVQPGFIHRPSANWARLYCYRRHSQVPHWEDEYPLLWLELIQHIPEFEFEVQGLGLLKQFAPLKLMSEPQQPDLEPVISSPSGNPKSQALPLRSIEECQAQALSILARLRKNASPAAFSNSSH